MDSDTASTSNATQTPRSRRTFRLVAMTSIFPIASAIIAFWYYRGTFKGDFSTDQAHWGSFGDFMGGMVNPVAGLVTIVLLVLTLRSQQDELSEQRAQISRQAFEQTFFTWLTGYRSGVESLVFTRNGTHHTGILALEEIVNDCDPADTVTAASFLTLQMDPTLFTEAQIQNFKSQYVKKTSDWWESVYNGHETQLGGLIRTLFTLIRWIDHQPQSLLSPQDKWKYVAIVRARLSSPELQMLFFNGYIAKGHPFREFVDRYALLDNLNLKKHGYIVIAHNTQRTPFSPSAFDSDIARGLLGISKPGSDVAANAP